MCTRVTTGPVRLTMLSCDYNAVSYPTVVLVCLCCVAQTAASHLDDLALFERQLLVSRVRVWGHGEGVIVKQSHKYTRQVLRVRLLVVLRGAALSPVPVGAPTVPI